MGFGSHHVPSEGFDWVDRTPNSPPTESTHTVACELARDNNYTKTIRALVHAERVVKHAKNQLNRRESLRAELNRIRVGQLTDCYKDLVSAIFLRRQVIVIARDWWPELSDFWQSIGMLDEVEVRHASEHLQFFARMHRVIDGHGNIEALSVEVDLDTLHDSVGTTFGRHCVDLAIIPINHWETWAQKTANLFRYCEDTWLSDRKRYLRRVRGRVMYMFAKSYHSDNDDYSDDDTDVSCDDSHDSAYMSG
jgi:hypothetical protein